MMVAVLASYFGGFLGIGLAGLIIGFAAVTYVSIWQAKVLVESRRRQRLRASKEGSA